VISPPATDAALAADLLAVVARIKRLANQPNMTRQVRRLEDAGLVSRTTDSADARAVLISITAKGHSVLAQDHAQRGTAIDQRLARLDDADRQTLAEAVRIMRSLLDDAQRHR
jgi:DNA-binding MarR family transcriptional regulator